MTANARMSPEREAELRAEHVLDTADDSTFCRGCDWWAPCPVIEALEALTAERDAVEMQENAMHLAQHELLKALDERARQVEVVDSSAAVLGYVVFIPAGHMIVGQKPNDGPYPTLEALRDDVSIDPDDQIAAVVRVGPDGRIGS